MYYVLLALGPSGGFATEAAQEKAHSDCR